MKRVNDSMMYAWFGAALGVGTLGGCNLSKDFPPPGAAKSPSGNAITAKSGTPAANTAGGTATANAGGTTAVAPAVPLVVDYQEVPVGTRLCVVGSAKSAEVARSTGKPPSHVAEIGFGKDGQTVYFENKPDGMEKALKAEYAKRHP
jgi:hypothetical protein